MSNLKPNWIKVVHREIPMLYTSFFPGVRPDSQQVGLNLIGEDVSMCRYLNLLGDIYYDRNDMDKIARAVQSRYKESESFVLDLANKAYEMGDELMRIARTGAASDVSEWREHWPKFIASMERFQVFVMTPVSIERWLQAEIQKALDTRNIEDNEIFRILTAPEKPNTGYKELLSFMQIVDDVVDGDDTDKKVRAHLAEYSWIGGRFGYGKAWTEDDIQKRFKKAQQNYEPGRTQELVKKHEDINERSVEIMDDLKFTEDEQQIVAQAKEYAYLRTYRSDTIYHSLYELHTLLRKVGEKFGYTFAEILEMQADELSEINKKPIDKEALRDRMTGYIVYVDSDKNIFKIVSGEQAQACRLEFEKIVGADSNTIKETMEGQTANPGKGQGKVKVIITNREFDKFADGNVLVTPMTTPDFVPIMQRASAIVTDEGGILCHAAIVSRELNKPCVIGTGNATAILHDGDEVEVDADKGVVKKL